jgi:hypothetical protein
MNDSNPTIFGTCTRASCTGVSQHPDAFHRFDKEVADIADNREIIKVLEQTFEKIWDMIIDHDLPYPDFADDDDDITDEFRDWATNRVILAYFGKG